MSSFFRKLLSKLTIKAIFKQNCIKRNYDLLPIGFHGDKYTLQIVHFLLNKVDFFIETGTNVGSTLRYVGSHYPHLTCLSCEPDRQAFEIACENCCNYDNIQIYNTTSCRFLNTILSKYSRLSETNTLFWLDAHGYGFQWPLRDEIKFITKTFDWGYIMIDDFLVPGLECFGFDQYDNQICSFDYISDLFSNDLPYHLYYPNYEITTSNFHDLRGWGLIAFGYTEAPSFPDSFFQFIRRVK